MILPVNPSSSEQIKQIGNQRYMVSFAFHKSTQTEPSLEPEYKAKIALQKKQISKLTCIIDKLDDEVSKSDRILDANVKLNRQVEELNKSLLERMKDDDLLRSVRELFSPGQLYLLENPRLTTCSWKKEDIKEAIELRACGPQAYRLLKRKGYPLPGESTLRKWRRTMRMKRKDSETESETEIGMDSEDINHGNGSEDIVDHSKGHKQTEYVPHDNQQEAVFVYEIIDDIKNEKDLEVEGDYELILNGDSAIEQLEVKGGFFFASWNIFYYFFPIAEEEPLMIEDYILHNSET